MRVQVRRGAVQCWCIRLHLWCLARDFQGQGIVGKGAELVEKEPLMMQKVAWVWLGAKNL